MNSAVKSSAINGSHCFAAVLKKLQLLISTLIGTEIAFFM